VRTFESLGAEIVDVPIDHIHGNISAQLTIESAEPSTYHQKWLRECPELYGADVRALLEVGELMLATHYLQAQRYRTTLREQFTRAFQSVDLFVCPTLPFTATPVGATKVRIEGDTDESMLSAIMQFTGVASLTGLPGMSAPCGFDRDGLPIGMQLIGRPFEEHRLFQIAAAYQRVTHFHQQRPRLIPRPDLLPLGRPALNLPPTSCSIGLGTERSGQGGDHGSLPDGEHRADRSVRLLA
jgi:aspartyl-tRNA(Asn)/glutamyl-tRNA(Gln) amidotransferase subunit A